MSFLSDLGKSVSAKYKELKELQTEVKNLIVASDSKLEKIQEAQKQLKLKEQELLHKEKAILTLQNDLNTGVQWLDEKVADYFQYFDLELAKKLILKKHKAPKSASAVKLIAKEKREIEKELRAAKNIVYYYESLFPWLEDYRPIDLNELSISASVEDDSDIDPARKFVSKIDWEKLNSIERNQLALDRFKVSSRTKSQIGRDYERYIGYIYEIMGYSVSYVGIIEGLEDLGRDLICTKGNEIKIIQCKCWSENKVIRENAVNQLFGTTIKYMIDNKINPSSFFTRNNDQDSGIVVKAALYTSTNLSAEARSFANALNIEYAEGVKLKKDYPMIKCNETSPSGKVYHLPFDQQYDKLIMDREKGRFYLEAVEEAEKLGFRRVYKWAGNNES